MHTAREFKSYFSLKFLGLLTEQNEERQKQAAFIAKENSALLRSFSDQINDMEKRLYNECLSGKHNCSVNANCISIHKTFQVFNFNLEYIL